MVYSYQWLRTIIDLPSKIEDKKKFQSLISTRIAEVEEVISLKEYLVHVEVVEILKFEAHPQADQLRLVTIKTSHGEKIIVCGDLDLKIGDYVPFAPLGTELPDFKLEAKKIRGILSEGMLCSAKELRLSHEDAGVMRLKAHDFGKKLSELFPVEYLIHIDNKSITHRPDLWGHRGFARELAVLFDLTFKNLEKLNIEKKDSQEIKIADKNCLAFYALKIEGVEVKQSPSWLKERLNALGEKSHNNLVDLSNYILFHWGLPIHFFDLDKIKFPLEVRLAKKGEELELLDEEKISLEGFETILAHTKPLILSGIKGGKESGVQNQTKNLLIEVANWSASSIRKTSSFHHIRTEASARFEKAQDSNLCSMVIKDLEKHLKEWFPKAKISLIHAYEEEQKDTILPFRKEFFEAKLGIKIEEKNLQKIFQALGFVIQKNKIHVPTYRATKDITEEIDLIEEFGRHYGYENIQSSYLKADLKPEKFTDEYLLKKNIRSFLVHHAHAYDVLSSSFISKERALEVNLNKSVATKNPVSIEAELLRESLLVTHLKILEMNSKQEDFFQFFEIGKIYSQEQESESLGFMVFSKEEPTLLHLLKMTEDLLIFLKRPYQIKEIHHSLNYAHQALSLVLAGKEKGSLISLKPSFLRKRKIKGFASYLECNLENWTKEKKSFFQAYPLTPQVHFDFTIIQSEKDPSIVDFLEKTFKKDIEKVRLIVKYPIDHEKIALTLRVFFKNEGKTYSSEEIKILENKFLEACSENSFQLKK